MKDGMTTAMQDSQLALILIEWETSKVIAVVIHQWWSVSIDQYKRFSLKLKIFEVKKFSRKVHNYKIISIFIS